MELSESEDATEFFAAVKVKFTTLIQQTISSPHFPSGIEKRANASARENHPTQERRDAHFSLSPQRLAFLAWGDFHARSRFARSTIPEEK